ncbi:helix-turn-helix domain-containing protein [Weissella cibaria]|uniref:helix-turn-helix domain-containing protein n=1 Tax=Weissella cibaria TaxID=137591 RepID=UPI0039A5F9D0
MNNLKTLRDFFQLGATEVSQALQITVAELNDYESGKKQPEILMWQRFAEYYADKFHVDALPDNTEPIHFRLSVDYLMNIGLTMNDLLAFNGILITPGRKLVNLQSRYCQPTGSLKRNVGPLT